jgi:hypothetical protein
MKRVNRWLARAAALAALLVAFFILPTRGTATIEEQRQRLPPPAQCGDDIVEGIWKSHKYDRRFGEWVIFILEIHRVEGDPNRLTGLITNHSWVGGPREEEPPPCGPGRAEWVIETDAEGSVDPQTGHIRFRGINQWRLLRRVCPAAYWSGYNLDRFDGIIDTTLNEFQTHNNDGGRDVNEPYVFRRIRCFPEEMEQAPRVEAVPPAFYPESEGGCGLF